MYPKNHHRTILKWNWMPANNKLLFTHKFAPKRKIARIEIFESIQIPLLVTIQWMLLMYGNIFRVIYYICFRFKRAKISVALHSAISISSRYVLYMSWKSWVLISESNLSRLNDQFCITSVLKSCENLIKMDLMV